MIVASTCIWSFSFTGCFCMHIFELYLFFTSLSKKGEDYPSNISFQINSAPCLSAWPSSRRGEPRQFDISHFLVTHGNPYSLKRKHDRCMVLLLHLSRQMCAGNVKGGESSLLVNEDNIEPMVLDVCPHCPTILKA